MMNSGKFCSIVFGIIFLSQFFVDVIGQYSHPEIYEDGINGERWCQYLQTTPEPQILFYPRMPKCGSSTMEVLCEEFSKSRGFSHYALRDELWGDIENNTNKRATLIRVVSKKFKESSGFLITDGHEGETIFSEGELGAEHVEYIQLIRECRGRAESEFYYKLFKSSSAVRAARANISASYVADVLHSKVDPKKCFKDYTCLSRAKFSFHADESFFICGDNCTNAFKSNPYLGLVHSLRNPNIFSVMGITENIEEFLEMLECAYPTYLYDMAKVYREHPQHANENSKKSAPSDAMIKVLNELCDPAVNAYSKFYDFAKFFIHERYLYMKTHKDTCCRKRQKKANF